MKAKSISKAVLNAVGPEIAACTPAELVLLGIMLEKVASGGESDAAPIKACPDKSGPTPRQSGCEVDK